MVTIGASEVNVCLGTPARYPLSNVGSKSVIAVGSAHVPDLGGPVALHTIVALHRAEKLPVHSPYSHPNVVRVVAGHEAHSAPHSVAMLGCKHSGTPVSVALVPICRARHVILLNQMNCWTTPYRHPRFRVRPSPAPKSRAPGRYELPYRVLCPLLVLSSNSRSPRWELNPLTGSVSALPGI